MRPAAVSSIFPGWIWGQMPPRRPHTVPGSPVQEGCGCSPVKAGRPHGTRHSEGKGNALDAHARLPVVLTAGSFLVVVTALVAQPPRLPVLAVIHAGQVIAHGSVPFCGGEVPPAQNLVDVPLDGLQLHARPLFLFVVGVIQAVFLRDKLRRSRPATLSRAGSL